MYKRQLVTQSSGSMESAAAYAEAAPPDDPLVLCVSPSARRVAAAAVVFEECTASRAARPSFDVDISSSAC